MNILVTGGTGYIGSHTCVELLKNNHSVIIADNLINSKIETLDKIEEISSKTVAFHDVVSSNHFRVDESAEVSQNNYKTGELCENYDSFKTSSSFGYFWGKIYK